MSRRRFDKKNAQTFSVVHRGHDDEHFFDNDASKHVLVPVKGGNKKANPSGPGAQTKFFSANDIAGDIKGNIRENEGLAAQYGIYYDDSKYDYMQHLKPIGEKEDAVFVAASGKDKAKVGGKKPNIEELFEGQLPSKNKVHVTNRQLQSIPDELQGFNPGMDPRLREVLEALDDEAYLERNEEKGVGYEDDDEDLFADLLASGEVEYDDDDYYDDEGDYDEWDLDNYDDGEFDRYEDKNYRDEDEYEYEEGEGQNELEFENPYNEGEAPEEAKATFLFAPSDNKNKSVSAGWEKDFMKYKAASKNNANDWDSDNEFEDEEDDILPELPPLGAAGGVKSSKKLKNKLRKKKGAMSDTSAFSMLSSALFRTEGLTVLDDLYDQLQKRQEAEEEAEYEKEYEEFDMLKQRTDFEDLLDDFLDNYELEKGGRRLVKKDEEKKRLQEAVDLVSKGKVAARRRKEKEMSGLGKSFGGMRI